MDHGEVLDGRDWEGAPTSKNGFLRLADGDVTRQLAFECLPAVGCSRISTRILRAVEPKGGRVR